MLPWLDCMSRDASAASPQGGDPAAAGRVSAGRTDQERLRAGGDFWRRGGGASCAGFRASRWEESS